LRFSHNIFREAYRIYHRLSPENRKKAAADALHLPPLACAETFPAAI